jgi:hypothetical protein
MLRTVIARPAAFRSRAMSSAARRRVGLLAGARNVERQAGAVGPGVDAVGPARVAGGLEARARLGGGQALVGRGRRVGEGRRRVDEAGRAGGAVAEQQHVDQPLEVDAAGDHAAHLGVVEAALGDVHDQDGGGEAGALLQRDVGAAGEALDQAGGHGPDGDVDLAGEQRLEGGGLVADDRGDDRVERGGGAPVVGVGDEPVVLVALVLGDPVGAGPHRARHGAGLVDALPDVARQHRQVGEAGLHEGGVGGAQGQADLERPAHLDLGDLVGGGGEAAEDVGLVVADAEGDVVGREGRAVVPAHALAQREVVDDVVLDAQVGGQPRLRDEVDVHQEQLVVDQRHQLVAWVARLVGVWGQRPLVLRDRHAQRAVVGGERGAERDGQQRGDEARADPAHPDLLRAQRGDRAAHPARRSRYRVRGAVVLADDDTGSSSPCPPHLGCGQCVDLCDPPVAPVASGRRRCPQRTVARFPQVPSHPVYAATMYPPRLGSEAARPPTAAGAGGCA